MPKKTFAADDLIFILCEKLRPLFDGRTVPGIAVVPDALNGWTALISPKSRRANPELDGLVAQVQETLRRRYDLTES